MNIAEKITRAKADYDAVYDGGKEKAFAKVEPINTELEQILYGKDTGGRGFYDEFWDEFQQNGNRTDYEGAFAGYGWNAKVLKPKYNLTKVNQGSNMFWSNKNEMDLVEVLSNAGIVLDTSTISNASNMFSFCNFTRIGVMDFTKLYAEAYSIFLSCKKLKTIDKIILPDRAFNYNSWFNGCDALENITIEGIIRSNGFNIKSSSKLSKASITSIINALSSTTSGLSITLSNTAVNKAFETSDGANDGSTSADWNALIAPKSNWTISLV